MDSESNSLRRELYFLIAKFLASGPCQRSAKALLEELTHHDLLCERLDWEGNHHPISHQQMVLRNSHIPDDFLLQVCSRLGPLLEKCIPSGVKGITSLLGAGRHSLLRNGSEKDRPTISSLASSHHDCPLLPATSQGLCPNLGQSVISREISGFRSKRQLAQPNTYSKQTMHRRILGHLSAVYCVLFDRSGHCIITGADDSLVKMWSTRDGHLLATLRGHNAEITDIAINYENTLLATGSCDKLIRVWSLKTTYPVAILQGHTGMITSLAFCPSALKESRYLMSTGADGTVCFWKWNENDLSFETTPIRFMEKTRPGSQMVCSSFSPGGSFLVAGSTDHIIRLYQLTPGPPEKIAEVDVHTDHVDSIQFSHNGEKFLSGSKDGTARIWYFKRSKWENILLDISKTLSGTSQADDGNKANKPRVTMVSWDLWDHHVVTAINDHSIKVWNAWTGQLVHILEGHHDELFVLEAHPVDPYVFLSAGHDGLVVLWDLRTGKKITSFFNSIEGQGHGAVFDCKFSPDGLQFACTDSHGHLCIFGYGDSEPFNKVPSEQFFHTDYRPLIRDANNYVLDEQTQTAPHLMPPPFLVDVDGNPHPLHYQQLVPGHGSNIRNAPPTPRADLPPLLAEIEEAENRQRAVIQAPSSPTNQGEGLLPPLQSPGGSRNYGMRQSGDIEGVRQAQGNVPVIEDVAETDIALWRRRLIIPDMKPTTAKYDEERRLFLGKNELTNYLREKKKRPQATAAVRLVNQLIQESLSQGGEGQGHGNQRRTSSRQAARARSRASRVRHVTDRVSSRSAYATRAAVEMVMDESGDDEMIALTTSHSEEEEEWTGSSSDSSEYSDWTEDVGLRSSSSHNENRRSRRVRRVLSTSDEDHEDQEASQSSSPQPDRPKKEKKSKKTTKPKIVPKGPNTDDVQDIIDYYQPSEWITCTKPRVSPYVPQIGDEVYYFPQGHEKYVKEVIRHKLYEINPKKQCYYKLRLKSEELCRIVSLHYSLQNGHPPTLCCIKLAQINAEGLMTGGTFSIKYHDMPDVLDFVILRQLYERAMAKNWREGDRFRSVIDETWWSGIITQYSPLDEEFPDSHFQCLEVLWDTGETERMSPWDLQSVTNDDPGDSDNQAANHDSSGTSTSNIPLTDEDRRSLLYEPTEVDWLEEGRDEMTNRIMSCIESVYQLSMAGPFLYPVDVQTYPDYWSIVCYPTDLTTIIQKLENRFYRRANALIWEIKQIERNARLFNEEESQIVRNSTKFVNVFVQFIRNRECRDILSLCDGDVHEQGEIEVTHLSEAESDANNGDEAGPSDRGKRKRPEKKSSNKRIKREERQQPIEESWITSARNLLQFLMSREDAEPFLAPVNLDEFPDYLDYVQEPMDFTTVSEKLAEGNYSDPDAFVRDVRLVFSNSRAYNTLPRSRIYSMTIRLSAMFEDRVDSILSEWYATASGGARRTRLRTQQLLHNDRPSLYQIVDNSTREDSSQYRVLPQTSSSSDHLRTTIRLPQSRNNRSSDSGSSTGRVPPLRISIPTVAETTTQQVQHQTTTQGTRQRQRTAVHVEHNRNRNAARRSEPLVNGSLTHQYSTRRSRRLQSEESQSGDDDDDDEQEENKSEDDDDDEEDVDDEENEEQDDDDDDSDDESDESEEDSPVNSRISRRSTVRPTMRPTALPRSSRTTSNSKKTRKASSSSASGSTSHNQRKSSSSEGKRISSNTRSRKVTYTESESDSDSEMMNVSSRGRIRRPTQRMLDYVE